MQSYCQKDLGHLQLTYQSAHRKGISLVCGINAHFLSLHCHISIMWIDHFICSSEPSRCTRFSIQVNGARIQVNNSYLSHRWRVFFLHDGIFVSLRICCSLNANPATLEIIVVFKVKVGANFRVFTCLRSFYKLLELNGKV